MREIKFRAWDPVEEQMILPDRILGYKFSELIGNWSEQGAKTIFLMQWTGLKDKTGKEIYEGDIVEIERYDNYVHEWLPYTKEPVTYETEYCAYFAGKEDMSAFTGRHCEVIGNIYENPELLEKENIHSA